MAVKNTFTTEYIIENATRIFHENRWAFGIVVCPYCGSIHIKEYDGYRYKCNSCKARFSDRTKTLMHGSSTPISKWMQMVYEMTVDNKISSINLAIKIGVNQKTAWLMQAKIRYALDAEGIELSGEIAQDEMYVGGCLTNYHYGRKLRLLRDRNLMGKDDKRYTKSAIYTLNKRLKTPVFGMNDGKHIVLYAVPNPVKKSYLHTIYKKHVVGDSVCISDESLLYEDWEQVTGSKIYTNNHHNNQYKTANGLTSNRIENTFSWFKRGFTGRITHCKKQYMQLYLNEFCFKYNTRELSHEDRFKEAIKKMCGKQITYDELRKYNSLSMFKVIKRNPKHCYTFSDIKEMFESSSSLVESISIGKTTYYRKDFIVNEPF